MMLSCFALPQLGISLCVLCQVHLRIRSAHPGQRDSDCVESWRGCHRGRFCLDLPFFVFWLRKPSQEELYRCLCLMVFVPKPTTSCVFEQGNTQDITWKSDPNRVAVVDDVGCVYIFAAVPLRCSELLFRLVPPALPWQTGSKQKDIGGKNAK